MEFTKTQIPDILVVEPAIHKDERGFFIETYRETLFESAGIQYRFVQDNHSGSVRGTLRGMHYQVQQTQGKLVQVVSGVIFDVAVDLRRSSPTFGGWVGEILSAKNLRQLWIPPGFAHGFYVLSDWADVIYKVTDYYAPEWDRTLLWNDPEIGIEWPLINGGLLNISTKDAAGSRLRDADTFK